MNNLRINWDNVRIFLVVARTRSALEAANQLEIDHSTITRRLRRLERELAVKLFDRTPTGHHLTACGHRLLEAAEQIESTLSVADADIGGDSQMLTGQVRLGASEGFGSFFLAPHLAEFCVLHPAIAVDLLPMPRFVNLSKREADIAVSIERPESGSYVTCRLTDYRLRLYATRQYLAQRPPIKSPADLHAHRIIAYVDELIFSAELRYLQKLAPEATTSLCSTSVIAQFYAAQRGHALAILPCFMANTCPDLVPVLPKDVDVVRSFWLIAPRERREIARVRALWDFVRKRAEANHDFLMGETSNMDWCQ